MTARAISDALLYDMIAKQYADRADNMLCAAAMLDTALVIKTVMHHFFRESGS